MGHQVIQQPDGLLCVWSTVVDDFIIVDASPDELSDYYAEDAAQRARETTERIVKEVLNGNAQEIYHQFTMDFEEACEKTP